MTKPGVAAHPLNREETAGLVEHAFRREYGRLVSLFTRRLGTRHLQRIEDAVQGALMSALTAWTTRGRPDDPGAWLYRAAHNALMGDFRQTAGRRRLLEQSIACEPNQVSPDAAPPFDDEVADDVLRMLFVCCDERIPRESRTALALKTLCGFSTEEIALRLFITEANVYKRLARARARLRSARLVIDSPSAAILQVRLPSVHEVLYLLFNEGYLSANADQAIRRELCDEAVRLATLLAEHPVGAVPASQALLALMHLQTARLDARSTEADGLLLLEEQDRTLWDRHQIQLGLTWLARSAAGDVFTRYHAEAGIAAEHCLAPSFAETRWHEIADLYALLERVAPSPLHTLNRAVAVAEWQGPQAGLDLLRALAPPAWLTDSFVWAAVLADLYRRTGNIKASRRYAERAFADAPTAAVRTLVQRRLSATRPPNEKGFAP